MVELGESVGIIAAQSIGEPGTQLTMRTFHTGGVFSGQVAQSILAPHNGVIYYNSEKGGKNIYTKYREKAFLTLKEKTIVIYDKNIKKSAIKLPSNTLIFTKPKEKVFTKQIIAQISEEIIKQKKSKEIKEIKSTLSGQIVFDKKIKTDNINSKKKDKGIIWIISGNVVSYNSLQKSLLNINTKKTNMKNYIIINEKKYLRKKNNSINKIKIVEKNFSNITLKNKNNSFKINYLVEKNMVDKKELITKKLQTKKILILEKSLFKTGEFIIKDKKLNTKTKNNYCSQLVQKTLDNITIKKTKPYYISKESKINKKNYSPIKKNNSLFYTYYKKQKTEDIVQGLPKIEELLEAKKTFNLEKIVNNPHDKLKKIFFTLKKKYNNLIATRKSIEKLQNYLINKIQLVYQSQGVKISNKHMEIIVKQMTSKVIIYDQGESSLIAGEIVEINKIEKINEKLLIKIKYEPILLGISKLSLSNQSFISEASFQETTKILTRSAIEGKIDWLYGLKENLILGNIIPAGTGYKRRILN